MKKTTNYLFRRNTAVLYLKILKIYLSAECLLMGFVVSKIPISNPYVKFIVSGIFAVLVAMGVNSLIFWRKPEFKYLRDKIISIVIGKLKRA